MLRKRILFTGAALAAIIAAGGTAYTASNTVPDATLGYGTNTVSGGTVNSIVYNTSTDGSNIDSVTLVMAGDTTDSAVSIGFNTAATTSCGTGTFDSTADATTYLCKNGTDNFAQPTKDLTSTAVLVN